MRDGGRGARAGDVAGREMSPGGGAGGPAPPRALSSTLLPLPRPRSARSARAPPPHHSPLSLPAEEGKCERGRLHPRRLGLVPAFCLPPIGRTAPAVGVRLVGAVLDTKFKVFKSTRGGGGALTGRGRAALQVSAGGQRGSYGRAGPV